MSLHMLTTVDNPWNPFTHFNEWYEFDESKGYCSSGLLARIAKTSIEFTDSFNSLQIEMGIDDIVRENVSGIHRRINESGILSDHDGNETKLEDVKPIE